jgi:tetratricopeptide (TPR) repeat protein
MQFLSDAIRVTIARRLVDRWLELAVYFGIPPADRAAFPKGNEPLKILEWLEQRNKLSANELQESFQKLQWDDLITELETPQSSNEDSPIEDFGTQTRMKDVIEDNPYLLGTSFVGREQELNDLTSWLTETDCKYTNSRILCICDLGGTGKSALVWNWFNDIDNKRLVAQQGYNSFWATFYARNYDWFQFLLHFSKELNLRVVGRLDTLQSQLDLQDAILERLQEEKWLILLDGLEREMGAFADPENQLVDSEEQDLRNELGHVSDEDKYIRSPVFVEFIRRLLSTQSKILITSRLVPQNLLIDSKKPLDGVAIYPFQPLNHPDAIKIWEMGGASSSSNLLQDFFKLVGYHPQLIVIVSAAVTASGCLSFEEWLSEFPQEKQALCLDYSTPKTSLRHHWLDLATHDIVTKRRKSWILLCRIATRSDATRLEVLRETTVCKVSEHMQLKLFKTEKWLVEELKALERRCLVGVDFSREAVDVHPVVRGHITKYILKQFDLPPTEADQDILQLLQENEVAPEFMSKMLTQANIEEALRTLNGKTIDYFQVQFGNKSALINILAKLFSRESNRVKPWLSSLPELELRKEQALCLLTTGSVLMTLGRWDEAPILFRRAELAYRLCGDLISVEDCQRSQAWQTLYAGSLWRCEQHRLNLLEQSKDPRSSDIHWVTLLLSIRESSMAARLLNQVKTETRWELQTVAESWYYLEEYDKAFNYAVRSLKCQAQESPDQRLWEWVTLGLASLRLSKLPTAANFLTRSIERGTGRSYPIIPMFARAGYIECLYKEAMSLEYSSRRMAKLEAACEEYKRYSQADPNNIYQIPASEAHLATAKTMLAMGEKTQALALALQSLEIARGKDAPFSYAAGEKRAVGFLRNLDPEYQIPQCQPVIDEYSMREHESRISRIIAIWERNNEQ